MGGRFLASNILSFLLCAVGLMLTDNFWPDLAQTYIDLLYLLLLSARFRILDLWPFIGGAWRGRRYTNKAKRMSRHISRYFSTTAQDYSKILSKVFENIHNFRVASRLTVDVETLRARVAIKTNVKTPKFPSLERRQLITPNFYQ